MDERELLIPTKLVRCKRKSLSLQIKNNGDFIVRAPIKMPDKNIFDFITQKSGWIIKKRTTQLSSEFAPLTFNRSERINIFGVSHQIVLMDKKNIFCQDGIIFVPNVEPKNNLVKYLKKLAKAYITNRVAELAALYNFEYLGISISSAKSCWGSCSYNNKLHFTYKLIMCPKAVIDYIILHELCHTKVKNHSEKFWDLVRACDYDYKTKERWIKENKAIIEVI